MIFVTWGHGIWRQQKQYTTINGKSLKIAIALHFFDPPKNLVIFSWPLFNQQPHLSCRHPQKLDRHLVGNFEKKTTPFEPPKKSAGSVDGSVISEIPQPGWMLSCTCQGYRVNYDPWFIWEMLGLNPKNSLLTCAAEHEDVPDDSRAPWDDGPAVTKLDSPSLEVTFSTSKRVTQLTIPKKVRIAK